MDDHTDLSSAHIQSENTPDFLTVYVKVKNFLQFEIAEHVDNSFILRYKEQDYFLNFARLLWTMKQLKGIIDIDIDNKKGKMKIALRFSK